MSSPKWWSLQLSDDCPHARRRLGQDARGRCVTKRAPAEYACDGAISLRRPLGMPTCCGAPRRTPEAFGAFYDRYEDQLLAFFARASARRGALLGRDPLSASHARAARPSDRRDTCALAQSPGWRAGAQGQGARGVLGRLAPVRRAA
jgi:hypothetical protein